MSGTILALVATFLAGIGARDQMLLAGLTARQGWRPMLVITALITGALASFGAGLVAWALTSHYDDLGRLRATALALAIAGAESLLRPPRQPPKEPTHALGAAAIVLLIEQISDPARMLVLAIAIATDAPGPAAVGGMVGGGGALVLGAVFAPSLLDGAGMLKMLRRIAGALLVLAALAMVVALPEIVSGRPEIVSGRG